MSEMPSIILKNLLTDQQFVSKVFPYLKPEYFEGEHREVFNLYSEYQDKYNAIPSQEAVGVIVSEKKGYSESVFNSIVDLLSDIYDSDKTTDLEWSIDAAENYCREVSVRNAMYLCLDIENGDNKKYSRDAIPDIMKEAVSVCFDSDLGSDYFTSAEDRYDYYASPESTIPYPLEEFNRISGGGMGPGIHVVLGGTNVGKSALLCGFSGEWLKAGYNVLYITMEMSEIRVQQRIDANLTDLKIKDLASVSKEEFVRRVDSVQNKTNGRLKVKFYPTGTAHAGHIRHFIRELEQKENFVPDILVVDYINICQSQRVKGEDTNAKGKAITEELRALSMENKDKAKWFPIFSAGQFNRSGSSSVDPTTEHVSESFGMVQTADSVISIVIDPTTEEANQMVIKPLKMRDASKTDTRSQIIQVDFNHMRFHSVSAKSDVRTTHQKAIVQSVNHSKGKKTIDRLKSKDDNSTSQSATNLKKSVEW